MWIHPTSSAIGLPPEHLESGVHLVLRIEEAHALHLPPGTAADDYLDQRAREQLDRAALESLAAWRRSFDVALTGDGVCLPYVTEWGLFRIVIATLRAGAGLNAAVAEHRPDRLVLVGEDAVAQGLVEAVAAAAGIPASAEPGPPSGASEAPERAPKSLVQRLRQGAIRQVLRAGAPSLIRRRAILALSYWPMVPLFDRLLAEPSVHLAIPLEQAPSGPRRGLRAMLDGGWLGRSGPRARRAGRRTTDNLLRAAGQLPPPALDAYGFDLAPAIHNEMFAHLAAAGPEILARARTVRRAYRRWQPALVLGTYDAEPFPRLVISLAREASIPTFLLAHGAYLMPQTLLDMESGEAVAIYSEAVGVPGMRRDRPVHVVGYPLPQRPSPARRPRTNPPRVVVLGQNGHPYTSRFDERLVPRHYRVALAALQAALPSAEIVLRPHPSQHLGPIRATLAEFGPAGAEIDARSPIDGLLGSADLCIGSLSTATLQASLQGTDVVVLNVTGFTWTWPLGGDTPVPVVTDSLQLEAVLRRWDRRGALPGREALVSALGADRPGAVDRLSTLVMDAAGR